MEENKLIEILKTILFSQLLNHTLQIKIQLSQRLCKLFISFSMLFTNQQLYLLQNMETPQKGKNSRRVITTAATDKYDTIYITVEDEKRSRIKTQIHNDFTLIKKKLDFQSEKSRMCAVKTKNQTKIQSNYRKNMLNYLNKKFGEAITQRSTRQHEQKVIQSDHKQHKAKQNKIVEQITYTFQQFIYYCREGAAMQQMTQYQLGNILKQMSFIKTLLHDRLIILKLYNELQRKNIQNLFMFMIHFYVINNQKEIWESLKAKILQHIQHLFELQGVIISISELERLYLNGAKASKNGVFQLMKVNRQNRQTFSSLYHSLNKRKK